MYMWHTLLKQCNVVFLSHRKALALLVTGALSSVFQKVAFWRPSTVKWSYKNLIAFSPLPPLTNIVVFHYRTWYVVGSEPNDAIITLSFANCTSYVLSRADEKIVKMVNKERMKKLWCLEAERFTEKFLRPSNKILIVFVNKISVCSLLSREIFI